MANITTSSYIFILPQLKYLLLEVNIAQIQYSMLNWNVSITRFIITRSLHNIKRKSFIIKFCKSLINNRWGFTYFVIFNDCMLWWYRLSILIMLHFILDTKGEPCSTAKGLPGIHASWFFLYTSIPIHFYRALFIFKRLQKCIYLHAVITTK